MSDSLRPHEQYSPWNSPGQNTGRGSLSLLQGIFPTQGWNPVLSCCRWFIYQLSHQGSPRILEWVGYPSSSRSSQELNQGLLHCWRILYQLSYQGSSCLNMNSEPRTATHPSIRHLRKASKIEDRSKQQKVKRDLEETVGNSRS